MIEFVAGVPALVLFLVAVPPLAWAQIVSYRKMKLALTLVDDPFDVLRQLQESREIDIGENDRLIPCALTRNVPWQGAREMARVMVVRGQDSILVVDPYGTTDFLMSREDIRVPKLSLFRLTQIGWRGRLNAHGRKSWHRVVFERELLPILRS